MRARHNAQGFTLPELVVTVAVGSLLMLAITVTQIDVMRSGSRTDSRDNRLEAVRNGLDHVVEDLRLCSAPQALTNVVATQSNGVTTYTGTAQPAGTAGLGLTAACPAGGSTSYTYAVVGGVLMRSDGVNPPTQVAASIDQMSFVVDAQSLVSMTATTQPSDGNPVVVPTSVMPRVASLISLPPSPSPTPNGPTCGLGQAAWQKHWFSATTPNFSGSASVTGDLFTDGNLKMKGGGISGTGWATGSVSGNVGNPQPNQTSINQPTVNWTVLQNDAKQAPNVTINGDWTPNGPLIYTQPTIIYVSGNLKISGNAASIKGVVTIVVAGQVSLSGSSSLLPADASSAISILAKGTISLSASSQIHGVVYSLKQLTLSGSSSVTGLGVANQIKASGSANLTQDPSLLNVNFPDFNLVCPS